MSSTQDQEPSTQKSERDMRSPSRAPSHMGAPLGATPFGASETLGDYQGSITLERLADEGVITPLARAVTESVLRLSGERDERVAIAIALAQVALAFARAYTRTQ